MSGQDELVCARCTPLEAENASLRQALASLQAQLDDQADEITEKHQTQRMLEAKIRTMKADESRRNGDSPDAQKITSYLETWVRVAKKKRPASVDISLDGERAKLVRTMVKRFSWPDLQDALKGAELVPYMAYGKRVAATTRGAEWSMELKQIIGKSAYLEENRDNFRRAVEASETDQVWDAWVRKDAEAHAYAGLVFKQVVTADPRPSVQTLRALDRSDNVIALLGAAPEAKAA